MNRPGFTNTATLAFPIFGPWGRYAPLYGYGFGYGFNPWSYYGTSFIWGRYGGWYNPWGYYSYDPFYPYYPYSTYGYTDQPVDDDDRRPAKIELGSLRIKASPATAKVYVDGMLMGMVDDFDGLRNHLELEPGLHRIELRAEGYATLAKDVTVTTSTTTLRLTLKKK